MSDKQQTQDPPKSIGKGALFAMRFGITLVLVSLAYWATYAIWEADTHKPLVVVALLPLGWLAAVATSSFIVAMLYYSEDDQP